MSEEEWSRQFIRAFRQAAEDFYRTWATPMNDMQKAAWAALYQVVINYDRERSEATDGAGGSP